MDKLLVTGAGGFVGKHLVKQAVATWEVHGTGYSNDAPLQLSELLNGYIACDLTQEQDVKKLLLAAYDTIVHLAGHASPAESFDNAGTYVADNARMMVNLCEPLLAEQAKTRVIVVSTGAVYDSRQPMPLSEDSKTIPINPYVISKLTMEDLADYYRRRGLDCVVVRPFNHIGPGQSTGYLIPDLVTKLHAYLTEGEQITVGNLTTRRDYTDVRDVTAAYLAIAATKKLNSAVYNVCGGSSHSGQEMMNLLAKVMDVKLSPDTVKIDRSLVRPTDIAEIYGSHAKLTTDTGWEPRIPLEDTLKDVVEDWRSHN